MVLSLVRGFGICTQPRDRVSYDKRIKGCGDVINSDDLRAVLHGK